MRARKFEKIVTKCGKDCPWYIFINDKYYCNANRKIKHEHIEHAVSLQIFPEKCPLKEIKCLASVK